MQDFVLSYTRYLVDDLQAGYKTFKKYFILIQQRTCLNLRLNNNMK